MIDSVDQFIRLAEAHSEESRAQLRRDIASEAVWQEIIKQRRDLSRVVTLNKNLPESVIRLLATSEDPGVRLDIATRRKVPPDVREKLARDVDETVRASVALNPKTPEDILTTLAGDESSVVSAAASRRLRE